MSLLGSGLSGLFSLVLQNTLARYGKVISLLSDVACLRCIGARVAFEEFTELWKKKLWKSCVFEETRFDGIVFEISV